MKFVEYKAVKNANPLNTVFVILICSIVAILLGWLYSITGYVPIIYFNILIVIGLGLALGITTKVASKLFSIRDKKTRLIIVAIVILVAFYSIWISFIVQIYTSEFPSFINYFSYWIYPENILELITEINKYGTWSFGSSGSLMVNGAFLSLIWFGEALILFFIAIGYIFKTPENPYSEKLNKWYPKVVLKEEFENMYSSKRFISNIEENGIDYILNLSNGLGHKYTKISIFYLDGEDTQYVSLDSVLIETKSESKLNISEIVKPFKVSTQDAKKLIENFGAQKEFYLDY